MNHIQLLVVSAIVLCKRFTQYLTSNLRVQGSIRQIRRTRNAVLTSTFTNVLPGFGTLTARAFKGSERAASRLARSVAFVIGISLFVPMGNASSGSIDAIQSVHELADKQLTEKQEYCHDRITFLESSNRRDANNGSHWGYYQGRSKALKGAPDDYQFYWYWHYVQHRYGTTKYDEPNYCNALHHLRTKGWQ
jgi:hypothetical protein